MAAVVYDFPVLRAHGKMHLSVRVYLEAVQQKLLFIVRGDLDDAGSAERREFLGVVYYGSLEVEALSSAVWKVPSLPDVRKRRTNLTVVYDYHLRRRQSLLRAAAGVHEFYVNLETLGVETLLDHSLFFRSHLVCEDTAGAYCRRQCRECNQSSEKHSEGV